MGIANIMNVVDGGTLHFLGFGFWNETLIITPYPQYIVASPRYFKV